MVSKKKNKQKKVKETNNPVAYFKSIGIKPEKGKVNIKVDRIMRKRFGNETADMYWDEENTDSQSHAELIYSDLNLARIWYGTDFKLTIRIAKLLSSIEVPDGSDILDVGGGPGALSFWMSKIWNVNEITVADKYSSVGKKWAKEIGADRVSFVDDTLPSLNKLKGMQYDVIVMSRVIGFMGLPSHVESFNYDSYVTSNKGKRLNNLLDEIAVTFHSLLKPNGLLIVIDSWSSDRVLIIGRAFERNGLLVNLDLFSPTKVSLEHSTILFTKEPPSSLINNIPLGLATMLSLSQMIFIARSAAAETIRKLFGYDEAPIWTSEYESTIEDEGSVKIETFEKDGFVLSYKSTIKGDRILIMTPSIFISKHKGLISSEEKNRKY